MSGWFVIGIIVLVSFGALVKFAKLPRIGWEPLAAALVLACAGYAFQGRPDLAGAPAQAIKAKSKSVSDVLDMRASMDRNFSAARPYLILSDAFARDGKFKLGAAYIRSGIKRHPESADLWAGLAVQLLLANDGKMSPPALLAFERVRALGPKHPAPDYFKGLDALFSGKPDQTLMLWRRLLVKPPENAKWPAKLESQVVAVEKMVTMMTNGQQK